MKIKGEITKRNIEKEIIRIANIIKMIQHEIEKENEIVSNSYWIELISYYYDELRGLQHIQEFMEKQKLEKIIIVEVVEG